MVQTNQTKFDAIRVVSPACYGGEIKDQDRAYWSPVLGIGALCDGVSSSPKSREAAELGVAFSRVLFNDNAKQRLKVLCDWLVALRVQAQVSPRRIRDNRSEAMNTIMAEVIQEKMKVAFQTTLTAITVHVVDEEIVLEGVVCGDSGFFAFADDGELLASSLNGEWGSFDDTAEAGEKQIRFRPGVSLFTKILHDLSDELPLADHLGVHRQHAHNWFVCLPFEQLNAGTLMGSWQADEGYTLEPGDRLLVPRHLIGAQPSRAEDRYRPILYCRTIRKIPVAPAGPSSLTLRQASSVTAVLPDSFERGTWCHFRERFPKTAHFLLASDGFYNCFEKPDEMWNWLVEHEADLRSGNRQEEVLNELHMRLHAIQGDDDMSFVWISHTNRQAILIQNSSSEDDHGIGLM